jgi:O-antigen ligase
MPSGGNARPVLATLGLAFGAALALFAQRVPAKVLLAAGGCALLAIVASGMTPSGTLSGRESVDSPDRAHEWKAALDLAASHPVTGVGPGNAVFTWQDEDGTLRAVSFAHDEPLQVLASEGVVGAFIVIGGLAITGYWATRIFRRLGPRDRWVGACAVPGGVAIATQGLFDFVWHVPLIPVLGAALVGLMASGTPTGPSTRPMERQAPCQSQKQRDSQEQRDVNDS